MFHVIAATTIVKAITRATIPCGVYYLGVNFLQASGRAAATTVLSALRQGALLLPALYLLHALLGLPGLAAARAVADMLGAAIAALLFAAWRGLTWRY